MMVTLMVVVPSSTYIFFHKYANKNSEVERMNSLEQSPFSPLQTLCHTVSKHRHFVKLLSPEFVRGEDYDEVDIRRFTVQVIFREITNYSEGRALSRLYHKTVKPITQMYVSSRKCYDFGIKS